MTDQPPTSTQLSESLWAISTEGTIWQINPLNRCAAPVLHLDDLSCEVRQSFKRYVMQGLEGEQIRESVPGDAEQF